MCSRDGAHDWPVFWQSATFAELGPGQGLYFGEESFRLGGGLSEMMSALPAASEGEAAAPTGL